VLLELEATNIFRLNSKKASSIFICFAHQTVVLSFFPTHPQGFRVRTLHTLPIERKRVSIGVKLRRFSFEEGHRRGFEDLGKEEVLPEASVLDDEYS